MAIDSKTKTTTNNTDTADTTERPLARSLTRSYTTVFMHAEPGMDWHTRHLNMSPGASLALGGALGAVLSAAAVSPIVTVIDLSIVRASVDPSATGGLFGALRRTTADLWGGRLAWGRPLRLLFGVYGGTYLVANETMCFSALNGIDSKVPTAAAAAAFNVAAIAWKDHCFYGMFQKGGPKALPLPSYGLMALRDGLTITSSFIFKAQLQEHLEEQGMAHRDADLVASFAVPVSAQLLSTPLHILAMDLSKRPGAAAGARLAAMASGYATVLTGRVMRILPAFGLGGFINDMIKESFFAHNDVPLPLWAGGGKKKE